jgi:hypothetical protein
LRKKFWQKNVNVGGLLSDQKAKRATPSDIALALLMDTRF